MEDFDFYPPKPELMERESRGNLSVTIFSMVLFVLVFLMIFSEEVSLILLLLTILIVHELGHFVMMKVFGYKNVRMLFIPLMGAFVNGSKSEYSQKESFLVVGAGPFPGMIIGFLLVLFSQSFRSPEMFTIGVMFMVLNLVNLFPLDPLDGGQLFKLLVRRSHELFLMIFSFISSLIMIAVGYFFASYLLMIFGFLMGFRVRSLQKRYQMHKDLRTEDVNFTTTYKGLTNRDFSKIKDVILQHTPALNKYVDYAETEEINAILASQVNSVLVTPTRQDAGWLFKLAIIILWLASFSSPVILYYVLDLSWVEYVLSRW